jgi:hypothetical protein
MKYLLHTIALFLLCIHASAQEAPAPTPDPSALEGPEGAIARVGDIIITEDEFRRDLEYRWRKLEVQGRRHIEPNRRFRRETLDSLINGKVLEVVARNEGITVSDEEIQQEFALRRRALPTEEAFQEYLRAQRMTQEELLREIGRRLLTEKLIALKTVEITVSEDEIKQEYEKWRAEGRAMRRVHTVDVAHIYARPSSDDDAAWKEAEASIQKLRAQVIADNNIEAVAQRLWENPEGHLSGNVHHEAISGSVPEISERVDATEEGQISEPFRTDTGWHIVKVIRRNPPGLIPYESMRDQLEKIMLSVLKYKRLAEVVDSAKKILRIEIYEETANKVTLQHDADTVAPPAEAPPSPAPSDSAPAPAADTPPAVAAPAPAAPETAPAPAPAP